MIVGGFLAMLDSKSFLIDLNMSLFRVEKSVIRKRRSRQDQERSVKALEDGERMIDSNFLSDML